MSDTYMTQWWHILQEAASEADRRCDGEVPWRESYADVFPDARSLRRALGYYWEIRIRRPIDDGSVWETTDPHRGLLMVLSDCEPRLTPPRTSCSRVRKILRSALAPTS